MNARRLRRLGAISFAGFLLLSAGLHFVAGPLVRAVLPLVNDRIAGQGPVSIITLSRMERDRPTPTPAPTATPPPLVALRTQMHVAPLKFRELTANRIVLKPNVHPPATRRVRIVLLRPQRLQPTTAPETVVAAPTAPPVGMTRRVEASARADSGGTQTDLSGSIQWGDDNPARLIKQAPMIAPADAMKRARIEVEVGPDGNPLRARIIQSSGDAVLDEAALEAARKSSYAPATLNGLPVHGTCVVEFPPSESSST
ncbi:MAG: TonB family protein [Candidatus Eremiobacteraeota bacterium]|nr:TonB family protein [Candidatus Eremiobacteraeota bacterium]